MHLGQHSFSNDHFYFPTSLSLLLELSVGKTDASIWYKKRRGDQRRIMGIFYHLSCNYYHKVTDEFSHV